jgi:hypothetical protein
VTVCEAGRLPCGAPVTRTYVRTDHAHYHEGDERADVPFETARTCDEHAMGDGEEGRPDYGWRLVKDP